MAQREPGEFQSSREADKTLKELKKQTGMGKKINEKMSVRIAQVTAERDRLKAKGK